MKQKILLKQSMASEMKTPNGVAVVKQIEYIIKKSTSKENAHQTLIDQLLLTSDEASSILDSTLKKAISHIAKIFHVT